MSNECQRQFNDWRHYKQHDDDSKDDDVTHSLSSSLLYLSISLLALKQSGLVCQRCGARTKVT